MNASETGHTHKISFSPVQIRTIIGEMSGFSQAEIARLHRRETDGKTLAVQTIKNQLHEAVKIMGQGSDNYTVFLHLLDTNQIPYPGDILPEGIGREVRELLSDEQKRVLDTAYALRLRSCSQIGLDIGVSPKVIVDRLTRIRTILHARNNLHALAIWAVLRKSEELGIEPARRPLQESLWNPSEDRQSEAVLRMVQDRDDVGLILATPSTRREPVQYNTFQVLGVAANDEALSQLCQQQKDLPEALLDYSRNPHTEPYIELRIPDVQESSGLARVFYISSFSRFIPSTATMLRELSDNAKFASIREELLLSLG